MTKLDIYTQSFKTKYEAFVIGCDSIEEMELWDKEKHGEMDVFYANDLTSIIIRLIASDGKITHKETEYLNTSFGFDYTVNELCEVYESNADILDRSFDESFENGISYMRAINGKLADAYKELISLACDIIVESDGVVADAELAEVRRLNALLK